MSFSLSGLPISSSYDRLLQISGSDVYNGTGSLITSLNITASAINPGAPMLISFYRGYSLMGG